MTLHYVIPGRVELVGKHVDYGGGQSLTCAVDIAMRAAATPIRDRVLRVRQHGSRDVVETPISSGAQPGRAGWSTYVAAVARRIARDFPDANGGVDVHLASALPAAAGLSSSTTLTIALARSVVDATGVASRDLFQEHAGSPIGFAEYVAAIETGSAYGPFAGEAGVGVRGGAQDHVAIMCAREGMVGHFSYIPARVAGWAPWPSDHVLVIGVSGVRATKTGNAQTSYNRAADAVRWLVRHWNAMTHRDDPTLQAALASGPDASTRLATLARNAHGAPVSAEYLARRLDQFREECDVIVPGVANALRSTDLARVGALVDRSQTMAEEALENQVPETIHLQRSARELGAAAASTFGAGFGGAVWAMVQRDGHERFVDAWEESYVRTYPARASQARFLVTRPGPPAGVAHGASSGHVNG